MEFTNADVTHKKNTAHLNKILRLYKRQRKKNYYKTNSLMTVSFLQLELCRQKTKQVSVTEKGIKMVTPSEDRKFKRWRQGKKFADWDEKLRNCIKI